MPCPHSVKNAPVFCCQDSCDKNWSINEQPYKALGVKHSTTLSMLVESEITVLKMRVKNRFIGSEDSAINKIYKQLHSFATDLGMGWGESSNSPNESITYSSVYSSSCIFKCQF